jgi:hypothetical protein
LSQLAEPGLLKANFVRPSRSVTCARYRKTQIAERQREAQRLRKALEDTNADHHRTAATKFHDGRDNLWCLPGLWQVQRRRACGARGAQSPRPARRFRSPRQPRREFSAAAGLKKQLNGRAFIGQRICATRRLRPNRVS